MAYRTTTHRSYRNQCARLLSVLRDRRWHTTADLVRRVGHRFAAGKHLLVRAGVRIARARHPTRRWQHRYRLELPLRLPLRFRNA